MLDSLGSDYFVKGEEQNFPAMVRVSLLEGGDSCFVLAGFCAYCDAQEKTNTERGGKVSSLVIAQFGNTQRGIWKLLPMSVLDQAILHHFNFSDFFMRF